MPGTFSKRSDIVHNLREIVELSEIILQQYQASADEGEPIPFEVIAGAEIDVLEAEVDLAKELNEDAGQHALLDSISNIYQAQLTRLENSDSKRRESLETEIRIKILETNNRILRLAEL